MDDPGIQSLRRSPFSGAGDLGSVFSQLDSIASVPMSATEDLGVIPEVATYVQLGVSNGDFRVPSPDTASNLSDITNKLPSWSFVQSSGTAITARWVATTAGGSVVFTMAAGSAGDDSYIEQIVPMSGASADLRGATAIAAWASASISNSAEAYTTAQFLTGDGSTTTGAATTGTSLASTINAVGSMTVETLPDTTGRIPDAAGFLRIRIGLRRAAAIAGATNVLTLGSSYLRPLQSSVYVLDQTDPTTNSTWSIRASSGVLQIAGAGTSDTLIIPQTLKMANAVVMSGIVWASVTATRNDYSPTGWQTCSILALDPDAARTITGFAAPTDSVIGTIKVIHNVDSTFSITLSHADAASSAGNRILGANGANVVIRPYGSVTLMWIGESDASNLRWRMVSQV